MIGPAKILISLLACSLSAATPATYQVQAAPVPLVINELMAANGGFYRDPQGESDDWVEIYNAGNDAIDAAGMYLTDDPAVPTKWKIPTNAPSQTRIAARGYLLIWLDNDTTDPGLHASFKLDAADDQVALFDKDGATLRGSGDLQGPAQRYLLWQVPRRRRFVGLHDACRRRGLSMPSPTAGLLLIRSSVRTAGSMTHRLR